MKKIFLLALFSLLVSNFTFSQIPDHEYFKANGEVYFKFQNNLKLSLEDLTTIISIDKVTNDFIYAYANENEFKNFLKFSLNYQILPHPGDVPNVRMSSDVEEITDWNTYPTYEAYVAMMNNFAVSYPNICQIVDAGTTVQGRKILFAKISDNVGTREAEPQFMYSSTMHGDETAGYVLMLRLIDSLLTSYGNDARITNMVDNIEIWINPNANPDGTYRLGNNTVTGARRYNANGYDINRNFPDPAAGPNPNGPWQPETIIMMNLAQANKFVMSANFHGGTEVVNYPWDHKAALHPDDNWFYYISRQYADTVHANAPSYYMNGYDNGITNGYQWYQVFGGRQDYYTYFNYGREVTIEISDTKLLSASLLPAHWEYNKRSFLNYMEQCLFGISGVVLNSEGQPVKAKVFITSHDFDNSEVYSDSVTGFYQRMIYPGTYDVVVSAEDYSPVTFENVIVQQNSSTNLNVQLQSTIPVELASFTASTAGENIILNWKTATETNNQGFYIERKTNETTWQQIGFEEGAGNSTEPIQYSFTDINVSTAKYFYRLKQVDLDGTFEYSNTVEISFMKSQPTEFVLEQNYPNPFNPTTKIKFSISTPPRPSPYQGEGDREGFLVSLTVYDMIGNEIATLLNEPKSPGNYSVEFDGSKFASGIYICKLSVNSGSENLVKSIKMLLMK